MKRYLTNFVLLCLGFVLLWFVTSRGCDAQAGDARDWARPYYRIFNPYDGTFRYVQFDSVDMENVEREDVIPLAKPATYYGVGSKFFGSWLILADKGPTYPTPREYALHELKQAEDYNVKRLGKIGFSPDPYNIYSMSYGFVGKPMQTLAIGADGKIEMTGGLTMEDAVIILAGQMADNQIGIEQEWDRQQARINDVPPSHFKTPQGVTYTIGNVQDWSDGRLAGDTACGLKKVRVVADTGGKREVVLHELMHVATNCTISTNLHHAITEIAPPLLKILRENPDLVKYLISNPPSGEYK